MWSDRTCNVLCCSIDDASWTVIVGWDMELNKGTEPFVNVYHVRFEVVGRIVSFKVQIAMFPFEFCVECK